MATPSSIPAWEITYVDLTDYRPQGLKESDKTEQLSTHTHTHTRVHTQANQGVSSLHALEHML